MLRLNWITPYRFGPEDRPHLRALHLALVQELYQRGKVPVLLLLGCTGLLYAVLKPAMSGSLALRWLFPALVLVMVLRAVLGFQGHRLQDPSPRILPWYRLYLAGSLATGLVLGGIGLAAFHALDAGHFMLFALCMLGIGAVAVVSMAASPLCFTVLVTPALGSLIVGGLLAPPFGLGGLFALTVLVGLAALFVMSAYVHRSLCRTILLTLSLGDLALRDPLTGLRNRRYLMEFMQEETPRVLRRWLEGAAEVRNKRSISLILVDLDFFKQVNDQYGHAAGDAVLVQVAQLLREVVRKPDLVLRWGGEEFLILALDSDRVAPPLIAVRVHERLAQHTFRLPGGQSYQLTASVGFAIYPFHPHRPEGLAWEQVFRLADESLYTAKENGRNRIQGILPGPAPVEPSIAALSQPDPDFAEAARAGFIEVY